MSTVAQLPDSARPTTCNGCDLVSGLSALEATLSQFEASPRLEIAIALADQRRAVADEVAKLNKKDPESEVVRSVIENIRRAARNGALDLPLGGEERQRLRDWEAAGWPGLLASMMITSGWRWAEAPLLSKVPSWMWGEYTEWLFATPNPLITTEECRAFVIHVTRHSEELARWAERNIGSASVKAAVNEFVQCSPLRPVRFAGIDCCGAARSRGKILSRLLGRTAEPFEPFITSRIGRALRVGFIARNWEPGTDACAALARFEQWPAERVERVLFATTEPVSAFAWYLRDKAQEFHVLPSELDAQVAFVRNINLDVAVFVGDPTGSDEISRLGLFRMAGVQMVLNEAGLTSGLPEVDLCVVGGGDGAAVDPKTRSERLAIVPETALTYALRRGGDFELAYSREDLGVASDAVLLGAVLPATHGGAEQVATFIRILAEAPATKLLLHVLPDQGLPAVGVERFCAVVEALVRQTGIAPDRVSILAPEQATHEESRAIVRMADIFLCSKGATIWAAEAMSMGLPVVALNGPEAAWLRGENLADLVVVDADSLVAKAVALAADVDRRTKIKEQLTGSTPLACVDALAGSDAFLAVIEAAYDQLETRGRADFKKDATPVVAGSEADAAIAIEAANLALEYGDPIGAVDAAQRALSMKPADPAVRALYGRSLLAEGQAERAATYLLAAVERLNMDADLWYALAIALRNQGNNSEATQALETSLRLNPKRADGWLMLIQLAQLVGATDIARDAYHVLKQTAPEHPQLAELAPQFET